MDTSRKFNRFAKEFLFRASNENAASWHPEMETLGRELRDVPDSWTMEMVSVLVQFSRSVVSDSLRPHKSQHARPPCPSPSPRVHSDSCPSSQWCHPQGSKVKKKTKTVHQLADGVFWPLWAPDGPGLFTSECRDRGRFCCWGGRFRTAMGSGI